DGPRCALPDQLRCGSFFVSRRAVRVRGLLSRVMPHDLADAVGERSCGHQGGSTQSDSVKVPPDSEAGNIRETLVEGRHSVPEVRLGTTDTRMAAADGPVGALVPPDHRTVLRGRRPFTSHLVQACAVPMGFIAPSLDVLAGIEVRAALAVV